MSESTRKKIIAGILVVVVIWGYQNLKPPSDKPAPRKDTAAEVQKPAPKVAQAAAPKLVNVEQKVKEPWGSDPFRVVKSRKSPGQKESALKWVLSGILYNSSSPTAIINKKPVKQGDLINGARVVRIDKKTVTLEYNGNRMTVTVTKG